MDRLIGAKLLEQKAADLGLETDPEFHEQLASAIRGVYEQALLERLLADRIAVAESEIEEYYRQNQDRYFQPAIMQVRNITTDTELAAQRARDRILAGSSFRDVAAEISTHPSRAEGGALPPFSRGTYDPAFEAVAQQLRIGELSQVFKTPMGFHIIEKTGETPERLIPLDKVREDIRETLARQKAEEALKGLEAQLRSEASIRVNSVE
ncbi:MAG: Foldase protein PrsA 2 precursor [candidate division BRC1 bacterium ADurb.BinA364]|nr:MAG: Foldase protein PrsA 2 precursor [candidate division BRC1 bacterium ADurb.BinA364]